MRLFCLQKRKGPPVYFVGRWKISSHEINEEGNANVYVLSCGKSFFLSQETKKKLVCVVKKNPCRAIGGGIALFSIQNDFLTAFP